MDIMFDIETFGTKHDALILSIGATTFDPDAKSLLTAIPKKIGYFYCTLDLPEQLQQLNRRIDSDTVKWWLQTDQALLAKTLFEGPRLNREQFRRALYRWLGGLPAIKNIWCQGPSFDQTIVENYLENTPWPYGMVSDARTLKKLIRYHELSEGIEDKVKAAMTKLEMMDAAHNALFDARYQALRVTAEHIALRKALNGKKA